MAAPPDGPTYIHCPVCGGHEATYPAVHAVKVADNNRLGVYFVNTGYVSHTCQPRGEP